MFLFFFFFKAQLNTANSKVKYIRLALCSFYLGNPSHSASSAGNRQPAITLNQAGPCGSPMVHWPVIRPMTNSIYLPEGWHQYSGQNSFHRSFITWLQLKNRTPSCPCPPQSISTSYKNPSFLATVTLTVFIGLGLQFLKAKLL